MSQPVRGGQSNPFTTEQGRKSANLGHGESRGTMPPGPERGSKLQRSAVSGCRQAWAQRWQAPASGDFGPVRIGEAGVRA
jgi:hypothetical protein